MRLSLALLVLWPFLYFCKEIPPDGRPQNVILFIADGFGPAALALARATLDRPLALDAYLSGAVRTASADSPVTDSAAAATAYSCGLRTNNEMVGMDPAGRPCRSLTTELASRGYFTAVLTNTRLTHATPAAFSASARRREDEAAIASGQIQSEVNLLAGGGRREFVPVSAGGRREDGQDLIALAKDGGWRVLDGLKEFGRPGGKDLIFLGDNHLSYQLDRPPADPPFAEWTEQFMEKIIQLNKPFFLVIEAGRIDHAAHQNDAAAMVQEVLQLDEAFSRAIALAKKEGRTLVLATADHETGGLSLGHMKNGQAVYGFSPQVLRGVRSSTAAMAQKILTGQSCRSVLYEEAGIELAGPEIQQCAGMADLEQIALFLSRAISQRAGLVFSTTGHTGVDVGLYSAGPGRQEFQGTLDNWQLRDRILNVISR